MNLLRTETGKTLIEGHRGSEGLGVENSWQAIEQGLKAGADILELDVQMDLDGALVLLNDYILEDGRWVREVSTNDLRKISVKGEKIVFLPELLEWAKDKDIYLSLDIKNGFGFERNIFDRTLRLVKDSDLIEKVMFLSWDHAGLLALKKNHPNVTTRALIRGYPVRFVETMQQAQVDAVNLSMDLATHDLVKSFQGSGIAVFIGMTFRPNFAIANKWEVDGISCRDPRIARHIIESEDG